MAKLPAALEKFVRESKMLDKMMRYMYLIDYGRQLGDFPEEEKTEAITESVTPTRQGGFANIFRRMQEDAAPYATVNTN